jgi:branched-chain amino acid transport system ATP-binding protein
MQHALEVADRAYVLENGSIVLSGGSRDLLGNEHVKKAYLRI